MKQLILVSFSLSLCVYGWLNTRDYAWVPDDAPRWNPFAIKESGVGRTVARVLTEQANTSWHHGLFEKRPPNVSNPLSRWLDARTDGLGFQGRLKYRPVEQYPLRPYEVKQAIDQVENHVRLAFELDPGNYTAYDVYLFFLTTNVTQTEFASVNGTQLKDEDDDENPDAKGDAQAKEGPQPEKQTTVFRQWADQEGQRRHTRAIEVTEKAIRKFRPNTEDPERYLTGAAMWYNRFTLLAPEVEQRQKSAEERKKFEIIGLPTLDKMKYYLQAARDCQHDLEQKGLWQTIPERRIEFLKVAQLLEKTADSLAVALQVNRSHMDLERLGSTIWKPPGQN
jgi:hypothetical protein